MSFSAMQMWTLARFLPLVIGHLIPEDDAHWENFLRLLDIMDILFACPVGAEVGVLEALISDHHSTFIDLYPHASITMNPLFICQYSYWSKYIMNMYMYTCTCMLLCV